MNKNNYNKYENIICNNCGMKGHIYKFCNEPKNSIGIIFFNNFKNNIKLLQVQRKDSICYIDFIRGKYDLNNIDYIKTLLSNMTCKEKNNIISSSFNVLWNNIWCDSFNNRKFKKEYEMAKKKYNKLIKGCKNISLQNLVDECKGSYIDTEWGFPKGRRQRNETNLQCACREIYEETGLRHNKDYNILNYDPITIDFLGTNGIKYRHIYYIGEVISYKNKIIKMNDKNKYQKIEIGNIKWRTIDEIYSSIRLYNKYKYEILNKICSIVL